MKILIISDAASPQINGVVRTLQTTISVLEARGYEVKLISPNDFNSFSMPSYPEIKVPRSTKGLRDMMISFDPDFVHISTEGRLGWAARSLCIKLGWKFTSAYHTDFPAYLKNYYHVPLWLTYGVLRRFHRPSSNVMVSTDSVARELRYRGFDNIAKWGRGVDTTMFQPKTGMRIRPFNDPLPVLLSVGRVSLEKNLPAFLDLDILGHKVVIGDGPCLEDYRKRYPDVLFTGSLKGQQLADWYAEADVFVFPSRSDTFGLVIIEALASGTPVAAYPVKGPIDILNCRVGSMNHDLATAIHNASLLCDRDAISRYGKTFTWDAATDQFERSLVLKN